MAMAQEQRTHHRWLVIDVNQVLDHHLRRVNDIDIYYLKLNIFGKKITNLFYHAIGHGRQVLLVKIEQDNARFQAATQIEQRVEGEGGNMGLAPTIGALLHVLLILDPTGRLLPFAILAHACELIQLHKDLLAKHSIIK